MDEIKINLKALTVGQRWKLEELLIENQEIYNGAEDENEAALTYLQQFNAKNDF